MQQDFDTLLSGTRCGLFRKFYKNKINAYSVVSHKSGHNMCRGMHLQNTQYDYVLLEIVKEHTYLGVKIDHHSTCKLRAILAKLSVLKYNMPYNTLILMYL